MGKIFDIFFKDSEVAIWDTVKENWIMITIGIIALALIVMGIVLYLVDKRCKAVVSYEKMTFKQAFLVGVSQALAAAVPGVSRSGITMTVARSQGLDRESAAKFSFLLSAPIIAAAVLLSLGDFTFSLEFIAGVMASFVSGLLVIKFLMSYLKKGSKKRQFCIEKGVQTAQKREILQKAQKFYAQLVCLSNSFRSRSIMRFSNREM